MRAETAALNQEIVLSAMKAIAAWEEWAGVVPQGAARDLHLSLLRLSKGLIKAWRIYLGSSGGWRSVQASEAKSLPPASHEDDINRTRFGYAAGDGEFRRALSGKRSPGEFAKPSV